MCPVCLTTAALIAGSVTSTGGFAAVVVKKFGVKKFGAKSAADIHPVDHNPEDKNPAPIRSKEDPHV